jgi:hypothetical protein
MIDQDLVTFVKDLDTPAGDRVHIGNAPQGTPKPFVVIRRTGGNTPKTLGGLTLFARAQFSINVIVKGKDEAGAGGYNEAMPTANAICDAMKAFGKGLMATTEVEGVRVVNEPFDASEIDGDKVIRWLTQDVLITHR